MTGWRWRLTWNWAQTWLLHIIIEGSLLFQSKKINLYFNLDVNCWLGERIHNSTPHYHHSSGQKLLFIFILILWSTWWFYNLAGFKRMYPSIINVEYTKCYQLLFAEKYSTQELKDNIVYLSSHISDRFAAKCFRTQILTKVMRAKWWEIETTNQSNNLY